MLQQDVLMFGVREGVTDGVLVCVWVTDGVLVCVTVGVCVFVGVTVGVSVTVGVGVSVTVGVGVLVAVSVTVGVFVGVSVGVAVFVRVGVGVGSAPKTFTTILLFLSQKQEWCICIKNLTYCYCTQIFEDNHKTLFRYFILKKR